jgi:hypothetical protein
MAVSHTLDLVQGDTNPQLTMTLRDSNLAAPGETLDAENPETWAKINLNGGTVRLKLRLQGSDTLKDTLVATIIDPAEGVVAFEFGPDTLDTVGTLEGEIEYTDAGGGIQTVYDTIRIKLREQF